MRPGFVDNRGNVYFRCTHCGDSDNPNKAHAFVDVQGNSYCYKCGHVAQLSMQQYLYVQLEVCDLEEVMDPDWVPFDLEPLFPQGRRETLLTRYIVPDNKEAEAFAMRDGRGRLIGYQSRYPGKVMINEGDRGIDWHESDSGLLLTSDIDDPIYFVEGPYDVTKPRRVSAMGSLSLSTFKHLRSQVVWAWPDPDVISTPKKRRSFIETLNRVNDDICWIQGLIVSDKDPDECTTAQKISLKAANEFVRREYEYAHC